GVLDRLEIHEERRPAERAKRDGGKDRAFQTVRGALAQHAARRPRAGGVMIGHRVECPLDAVGRPERAQGSQLGGREAQVAHAPSERRGTRTIPHLLVRMRPSLPDSGAATTMASEPAWIASATAVASAKLAATPSGPIETPRTTKNPAKAKSPNRRP